MHLVPLQLDLFPHVPQVRIEPRRPMTDEERDRRSAGQWLRSVRAYLEFRTGDSWRRLSDPEQRWHPDRIYYLDAIRVLNGHLGFPDFLPEPTPKLLPKKLVTRARKARVA